MYVDSHCHLEIEDFEEDRGQVIEQSLAEGLVYMLTVGTEERYFARVKKIVERYPEVYGACGIHPHNGTGWNEGTAKRLAAALSHPGMVALGEIGLDFFRNHSPMADQIAAFEGQLSLAGELGLPVIIHSRSSQIESLSILGASVGSLKAGGVIHCFSYDLETAKRLLDMGFYISIPGTITYTKNTALIDVARFIPSDRILAETDAPFLAPVPYRGKRNLPYFVKITVARLAAVRNIGVEEMAMDIRQNFETLFLRGRKGAGK